MSLTIQLPSAIEQQIRENASVQGLSVEKYVTQTLLTGLGISQNKRKNKKTLTEKDLLQLVQLNVSVQEMEEYRRLGILYKSGNITESEHNDLLALNNRIEIAHAERMKYVIQLANLRGVSLEQTMIDLGLQNQG